MKEDQKNKKPDRDEEEEKWKNRSFGWLELGILYSPMITPGGSFPPFESLGIGKQNSGHSSESRRLESQATCHDTETGGMYSRNIGKTLISIT